MALIQTVSPEKAEGEVKEIYDICVIPNSRRPRVGELDMHLATEYKLVE